jgi:hypothetical protein
MIYFPETIIQWIQRYWGYLHTVFLLAMHVNTHSVHNRIPKPWRGRLLRVFSSCHVFPPPLSGLNWRSLTPTGGPSPSTPKMASLPTVRAHSLPRVQNSRCNLYFWVGRSFRGCTVPIQGKGGGEATCTVPIQEVWAGGLAFTVPIPRRVVRTYSL